MKRIALIGSPGSGKTKLAQAIAEELIRSDGQCADCNTPITIVDNYAQVVRDNGYYEIGLDGGYMANLAMAVERYNRERASQYSGSKTIISCGTVLESAVYMAQHFARTLNVLPEDDESRVREAQRIESAIKMLATLYMDTFKYTQAFYLPHAQPSEEERWVSFEKNLQASFSAYSAPVVPLLIEEFDGEDDLLKKQVERVLEPVVAQ